jgi:hypothetical protein
VSAAGNRSQTKVLQSANGSAGGDSGGFALIPQGALVINAGLGIASSGDNTATGNISDNENQDNLIQHVGDFAVPDGPVGVASNSGELSNWSDGEANIRTGDAQTVGNDSSTDVWQGHDAFIGPDGGVSIAPQVAAVLNLGAATANTGGNTATGNESVNEPGVTQTIPESGGVDIGVASNVGHAETSSDGTASIVTGASSSAGNRSTTDVEQNVLANGGFLNLQTQTALVGNVGIGQSSSGGNTATGNSSENGAFVEQDAILTEEDPGVDLGVVSQHGRASATSGGTAAIETGNASAVGNDSETDIGQTEDPSGLVINTQVAAVVNAGVANATTGGNTAIGNEALTSANLTQEVEVGQDNGSTTVIAGPIIESNTGEASSTSDGLATIKTGAAAATGNESGTSLRQEANGAIDGNGLILNTQPALVVNAGIAAASSGGNTAIGNTADDEAVVSQEADILDDNSGDATLVAGLVIASNNGTASSASDGEATITTGDAAAAGNQSQTVLAQNANGEIDGLGIVLNTQPAVVANVGVGVANSGGNEATGNASTGFADVDSNAEAVTDNEDASLIAPFVTVATSNSSESASDGTADIRTGAAQATGNTSATHLTQDASGHAPGLVLNTQLGGVLNAGAAVANSGGNVAFGNTSQNEAELQQDADILSDNDGNAEGIALGAVTASSSGTAANASDGNAVIKTGSAQAQGNVSSTFLGQSTESSVSGLGANLSTQIAGVANVGVGAANSGLNIAVGNDSENDAEADQEAEIGSANDDDVELNFIGPVTAATSADVSNASDGRAKVKTGGALATGNASATNLSQHLDADTGFGLILGTQVGGVANVGAGVANSGLNLAAGNLSDNDIDDVGGGNSEAEQDAEIVSDIAAPDPHTFVGPVTAVNSLTASNTSDGEACVCTGDAAASGNVSSTTLIQDLNLTAGVGVIVLTEAGGVLNAGVGLANTGLNGAVGNSSDNDVQFGQDSDINDALLPIDGPQTAHNGGTAASTSAGTALVASGNASGTGNQSTTDFVQAATVDSAFAVSALTGGTANAGVGLANSGLNFGLGNDSTNLAVLDQAADGSGLVSNQGEAINDSDGTAIIGNPEDCEDDKVTPPTEDEPGKPGLPRTGAELETQAAIALMLLLLGFGLRRRAQHLA